jgi:hypothetical protein
MYALIVSRKKFYYFKDLTKILLRISFSDLSFYLRFGCCENVQCILFIGGFLNAIFGYNRRGRFSNDGYHHIQKIPSKQTLFMTISLQNGIYMKSTCTLLYLLAIHKPILVTKFVHTFLPRKYRKQ